MVCDSVQTGMWVPTSRMNHMPPSLTNAGQVPKGTGKIITAYENKSS